MKHVFLALAVSSAALAGLGGCSSKVKTVSMTSSAVVLLYPPAQRRAADQRAVSLCNDYGKATQLRSLHDQYVTMEQTAVYDCVGGS